MLFSGPRTVISDIFCLRVPVGPITPRVPRSSRNQFTTVCTTILMPWSLHFRSISARYAPEISVRQSVLCQTVQSRVYPDISM